MSENQQNEGYIIEYIVIGKNVKVTAFDPATLKEVSIIGSTKASRNDIAKIAIRKLEYMIAKNKNNHA